MGPNSPLVRFELTYKLFSRVCRGRVANQPRPTTGPGRRRHLALHRGGQVRPDLKGQSMQTTERIGWMTVSAAEKKYAVDDAVIRYWVANGCTAWDGGKKVAKRKQRGKDVLRVWGDDVRDAAKAHREFRESPVPKGRLSTEEVLRRFPSISKYNLWDWRPEDSHSTKKRKRGSRRSAQKCPFLGNHAITVESHPVRRGDRVILGLFYLESEMQQIEAAQKQPRAVPGQLQPSNPTPLHYRGKSFWPLAFIQIQTTAPRNTLRRIFDGKRPSRSCASRGVIEEWEASAGYRPSKTTIPNPRLSSREKIDVLLERDALKLVDALKKVWPPVPARPVTEAPPKAQPKGDDKATPARVSLNAADQVTVDGEQFLLTPDQAFFIRCLLEAPAFEWVAGTKMEISRPDRTRDRLPVAVKVAVESCPRGYRLHPKYLDPK